MRWIRGGKGRFGAGGGRVRRCVLVLALLTGAGGVSGGTSEARAQGSNPLAGKKLYVDPNTAVSRQVAAWRRSRPADADRLQVIAQQPRTFWYGDWARDVRREVDRMVSTITGTGAMPVFVAYNIPYRDCGQYSAGGEKNARAYQQWIRNFAAGLRRRASVVILEPDALAGMGCLPAPAQVERLALVQDAVRVLKANGAYVYIDAGNARWVPAADMAARLNRAGIAEADGFALNISNFQKTELNIAYGEQLSRLVGGKHFVIDTSRNGAGTAASSEWCNARNQALGRAPTTNTGHPLVDAFLWIKTPGESDGTCRGGPRAGAWWADYALELSKMAETLQSVLPR